MTNQTEQTEQTPAPTPEPEEEPKYQIDAKEFETSGRSFSFAIYSRLSQSGKAVIDDGKSVGGFGAPAEYMKVMSNICSNEPDFLLPGTPITEAVFKLLLANTNKAMTLDEIQSGLTTAWASVIYLKNLSDEILRRMLDQENDYFIKRAIIRRRRSRSS
ncbi:MAG TPA: hypothetical protein EYG09_09620 [Dehalococcoidia bacterium]|jgi:hypothetical protein|nr:hypothetical protein [Dehalococcoidia bacterium]